VEGRRALVPRRLGLDVPARPARRRRLCRARSRPLRHEAAAPPREEVGGDRRAELPAAPEGQGGDGFDGAALAAEAASDLGARDRSARTARALVRYDPGRPLPQRERRRELAARREPLEPARAEALDGRRLRPRRHPQRARRPARSGDRHGRRLDRQRLAQRGRRRDVEQHQPGLPRRVSPEGEGLRPEPAGRSPRRAPRSPRASGRSTTTASSARRRTA
jgi:hypothetical protein